MSLLYTAPFNVTLINMGTLLVTRAASTTIAVTISAITDTQVDGSGTSGIFWHPYFNVLGANVRIEGEDPDGTVKFPEYARRPFAWALRDIMRTRATSAGWANPNDLSVVWDNTTGFYTILVSGGGYSIGLDFASTEQANFLSFAADSAAATSHTGTVTPTYCINPTLQAVSVRGGVTGENYEPRGIGNHAETDLGPGFGLSGAVCPIYRDFMQEFETREKTYRRSAAATHPWTFEHLVQHCRGHYPFATIDHENLVLEAFSFRSEGTAFEAMPDSPGNANQFHLTFQTVVEGTFEPFSP